MNIALYSLVLGTLGSLKSQQSGVVLEACGQVVRPSVSLKYQSVLREAMHRYSAVNAKDVITSLAVDRAAQEMIDLIRFWHNHNALDLDGEMSIVVLSKSYGDALC